ncbi:MAG: glycosyltransferase family 4 protein [Bifidobacteriaceae bacterium]|nr:glycosyltransferase family 4 protein [Bifidobacteriaceae bacterium]
MRIVHLVGPSQGGIGAHVDGLASAQRQAGHSVEVILGVGARARLADRSITRAIASADAVHAHGLKAGASAVLAVRRRRRGARPAVVVTLHNRPVGSRWVRGVGAGLARVVARADAVLGVSQDLVDWARRHGAKVSEWTPVPAPDIGPPSRPRASVLADLGLDPSVVLIITAARLARQKGLDLAIDAAAHAMAQLARAGAEQRFVWAIAGDGPERARLTGLIEQSGAPVMLLGRRADLPDLYGAADLVVSTAVWEGQPLGLQEALRAGAAVVATDVGGTRAVVGSGGVLVARDAGEVGDGIVGMICEPERLARAKQAARRRGEELPGPADMLAHVMAIYARAGAGG